MKRSLRLRPLADNSMLGKRAQRLEKDTIYQIN